MADPAPVTAVDVWWGRPADERAWHLDLLDATERGRRLRLRRSEDQARFTVATAILKRAAGRRLGRAAEQVVIDRSCPTCGRPHGRPRLPGSDLAASISHSGERVLVALTGGPAVGVDVERLAPLEVAALAGQVLAEGESAPAQADFFRYWTRKEAVVKATGDGLRMPLAAVSVSPPDQPPALRRYGDRRDLAVSMADLDAGEGYLAAVAVLTTDRLLIREHDAVVLLDS